LPTIHDVARAAGVGIGTVSRVLNRSELVSAATRQRVLDAIERLGYSPSPIARAFGRRRTDKLDVLIPAYAQAFLVEILRGIEAALVDTDCTLLVRAIVDADDRDRAFEACCVKGRADGALLVWMPASDSLARRVVEEHFPVLLLNGSDERLWSVGVDHDAAAERAVTYCMGLGHRRIALIDRPADPFGAPISGICRDGYLRALKHGDAPVRDEYQRIAALTPDAGAAATRELLQLSEPPTAVIVASEAQAIGALDAARRDGRRVPSELSVVGYNDNDVARFLGLTTVSVPLRDLGRLAAEQLLALVTGAQAQPQSTYLPTQLTVRRTCGPPLAERA
jgi:LacI family transcriptional regulator